MVLVLGARVALPSCEPSPVHSHPSVSASADRFVGFVALTSHDHIERESICASDMSAAAAVLSRIAPLAGSDFTAMAAIAPAGWLADMLSPMMRASPSRLAPSLTGRQILSRLCITIR
ncbi:putative copper homeostasis (lipo)protein LpqS [Mycolicibacterium novocastrense]